MIRRFPYGYTMINGTITVCEEEAGYVRRIYRELLEGSSMYSIAGRLYNEGIAYFKDSQKKSACKISMILRDRKYTGIDGFPEIIDTETFEKAQFSRKPYALKTKGNKKDVPVFDIKIDTVYTPSQSVMIMEQEIKNNLRNCQDSEKLRNMILQLAAEKYNCIH